MTLYIDADIAHELASAWQDIAMTLGEGNPVNDLQWQRVKNASTKYEEHVAERIRDAS